MVAKIFCFDIDQTLCHTQGTDYETAEPLLNRIEKVNSLFDSGSTIKILTARGSQTGIDWRILTETQLQKWGVKYHELHMSKPYADFYIDDKAISDIDFDWAI